MAESRNNYIMAGMSGLIGDLLVFKQWFGRTIVSRRPKKSGKVSVKQQAVRDKFELAANYATAALTDPAKLQGYKDKALPGQTPFNMALADYFIAPTIDQIDHSGYVGVAGNRIKIAATDDFLVDTVSVKILRPDSSLLEQGAATADPDGLHWWYTVTQANGAVSGSKLSVTATDLPANVTVKEEILP